MPIGTETISPEQASKVLSIAEGHFSDVKSIHIQPSRLTKSISAFANSDGGDVYIGVEEVGPKKTRRWNGFPDQEAANGHLQAFEQLFPLGTDFQYEFLGCENCPGLVLHVEVHKTRAIVKASNGIPYVRRSAQSLPVDTAEMLKRLEYTKGISSFETEAVNVQKRVVTESSVVQEFVSQVVPTSQPEPWLQKQLLLRDDRPTIACVLLFADEPQALLPKHCGIKITRYKTIEAEGRRDEMAFTPETVEGCLYEQIRRTVGQTASIIGSIPKMGDTALESVSYPAETLHEIITNAVLHRDYSIADDVHIRIFDNRVEVQSPGKLPAHITVANILNERFARNGAIVRILNKFPDPPNKDIGEGLNTAFEKMHELGLKEPIIEERENTVLVTIRHERLASPEEAIMDYLETHPTIKNAAARRITHIRADYRIKSIFGRMVNRGMIEQVPGTRTSNTAYRKTMKTLPARNGREDKKQK